jgi:microcompartment protein CcmK/EutM
MIPARVIGRLVPAATLSAFAGVPFLIVQPVNEALEDDGPPRVACDAIGANEGEFVFMSQGGEATFPLPDTFNPSDSTIVAIIDEVSGPGDTP